MLLTAISFLLGVCFIQQLTFLPGHILYLFFAIALIFCWLLRRTAGYPAVYALTVMLAGAAWAGVHGQHYLDRRLPEALAGQDMMVEGRVTGIPASGARSRRFSFVIDRIESAQAAEFRPENLRLSWYYGEPVHAGERWRFQVRLKPPHGFLNPGGFDYESWLYQHRIHATGYIRDSEHNRRLAPAPWYAIDAVRERLSRHIQQVLVGHDLAGLVTALAVGDRAAITPAQWDILIRTGTSHLMAISGLHIGLAALFGYQLVRRLLPVWVMQRVPAQTPALVAGLLLALGYALLAGLSIPTQRALIMLVTISLALLLRRCFRPVDALAAALLAVLLWDPVAVLSAGFWFSFIAVAAIFYVVQGADHRRRLWLRWGLLQGVLALALLPVSLWLFQQSSLVAPLANLVLVPWVSFTVVPCVLLGMVAATVSTAVADTLFSLAQTLLALPWPMLDHMAAWPFAVWVHAPSGLIAVFVAMAGVALLLQPRHRRLRWLGACLLLPLLPSGHEPPAAGSFELTALDVGQGLAVVVQTQHHALVYDTGARFSERLDAGEDVLLPFLRQRGIDDIDRLIISHGDADHIGGAPTLLAEYPGAQVLGQDIATLEAIDSRHCRRGQRWQWDGVSFEILHPPDRTTGERNNRSCVLRVASPAGRVLLTGDIERPAEFALLHCCEQRLKAEVLLVPHHGSRSSSAPAFIEAVAPRVALFPAGYRNRYRLPGRDVVQRYTSRGIDSHSTGYSGAITVRFDEQSGAPEVEHYRRQHGRYWNHAVVWPSMADSANQVR